MKRPVSVKKICDMLNLNYVKVTARLGQHGWSWCEAIEFCPRPKSIKKQCAEAGVSFSTVRDRMLRCGMSLEDAISAPVNYTKRQK